MKRVGLVLSGGGVRGIGHLGVLQVLDECDIHVDHVSGTSAGALIGALFAKGYSAHELLQIAKHTKIFGLPHVGAAGLFTMDKFRLLIDEYLPGESFESLKKQLVVAATDIVEGKPIYFNTGPVAIPVMASACVPVVFPPVVYNGTYLVDGGILDNFPVQPLKGQVDVIIGSHVNSLSQKVEHFRMKDILDRSFHFALGQSVYSKAEQCDIFFDPPEMSRFGMFDVHRAEEIYDHVYEYAASLKPRLLELKTLI